MGAAKLRRLHDPNYGQPLIYTLAIYAANTHDCLFEIPFTVRREASAKGQYRRVVAIALQIFGYLDAFDNALEGAVVAVLGEESLIPLRQLKNELPKQWWCDFWSNEGDRLTDIHSHKPVMFVTHQGIIPDGEDIGEIDEIQTGDFLPYAM